MFFDKLPHESRRILDSIPSLIEKTFPMPERFHRTLPSQVSELSRLLTNRKGDRSLSYLSRPNFLAAYLRYFMPWNLYRLCLLLPNLELSLSGGDTVIDLGCGPLTFVCALWISFPDLRSVPLEFYCIDRCAPALEAGKKFFTAVCTAGNSESLWKIHPVRENIDLRTASNITYKGKNASLVCAVNLFNEMYEKIPHTNKEGLKRMAENTARLMHRQALKEASILTVEPGVPQSGHFISLLRNAFLEMGRPSVSPCTHQTDCPLACISAVLPSLPRAVTQKQLNEKKRWCHFAFETTNATKELHRLSAAAGIPKKRLVLSYLLTGAVLRNIHSLKETEQAKKPAAEAKKEQEKIRVISDAFPLPGGRYGRYGCCANGLVLLTGEKSLIEKTKSGSVVSQNKRTFPIFTGNRQRDVKSGALIYEIK
jgi:ribosomal protein RSM22 (predicted rRNA methylase)